MFRQRPHEDWVDQHFLRADGPGGTLEPFSQVIAAADLLAHVARDRVSLSRQSYASIGTIQHQAVVLGDFARALDNDCTAMLRSASIVPRVLDADDEGVSLRARTLMHALSGAIDATATLIEICQALLGVAESLQATARPKSTIELVAAVEALRTGASTAFATVQANLDRITDAVKYDRLARRITAIDEVLDRSDQVLRGLRLHGPAVSPGVPAQRF